MKLKFFIGMLLFVLFTAGFSNSADAQRRYRGGYYGGYRPYRPAYVYPPYGPGWGYRRPYYRRPYYGRPYGYYPRYRGYGRPGYYYNRW